jgi:Ca2+-transporting ATPase
MTIGVGIQTISITGAVLGAYWLGREFFAARAGADPLITAETMAFVTLVLSELLRAYTSRSERYPLWKLGIFSNKWMQYAVGFSVVLLMVVVYIPVPAVREIFNTTPLTGEEWLAILPLILIPSIFAELQKFIIYRSNLLNVGKR